MVSEWRWSGLVEDLLAPDLARSRHRLRGERQGWEARLRSNRWNPWMVRTAVAAAAGAFVAVASLSAQEFFRAVDLRTPTAPGAECFYYSIRIPETREPRRVRISVTFVPDDAHLSMDLLNLGGFNGAVAGTDGYFEFVKMLPVGPSRNVSYCVGRVDARSEVVYSVYGHWVGSSDGSAPTGSWWTQYDDELYRHLVFDDHDSPGKLAQATSHVLWNPIPRFYIRTGGPDGCRNGWQWRLHDVGSLHFWRAVVPILAEQLTGLPYPHRVEAGCENRPDRRGWVMVHYTTPDEYLEETEKEWGGAGARARVGAGAGRIWMGAALLRRRLQGSLRAT